MPTRVGQAPTCHSSSHGDWEIQSTVTQLTSRSAARLSMSLYLFKYSQKQNFKVIKKLLTRLLRTDCSTETSICHWLESAWSTKQRRPQMDEKNK